MGVSTERIGLHYAHERYSCQHQQQRAYITFKQKHQPFMIEKKSSNTKVNFQIL